ncbi:FAD-dependent oxidoreductase [Bacillus sp. HMF5848]|uniref:dihydrolipoyl dehydrogenase family protein n=1 Tax=Bacillus sp. HMF5848 TaxID=2495421 RepID=UPI000F79E8F6|nr:FAD-dependent oxidoreductase [Bacillus sp. HMF5848]RSK27569.1 FAD-dependent oxidoreductase [Bacillus sp. HMF5848]
MKKYDLIVIGGGAGGLTAAAGAASLGAKVALIEKEEQPGGDCLHYGCVPSKALIETARIVHEARKSSDLGFNLEGTVDMKQVKKRIKEAIATIQKHDDADRFRSLGIDVYIGKGSFFSRHEVHINGEEVIYGKKIVISTGSRPFIPPIKGIKEAGFITNETIFDLEHVPQNLLVVGGGPIGLEMAQAMSRLGSNVTVVERAPEILIREDEEIRNLATDSLSREISIHTNASVEEVKIVNNEKLVIIKKDEKVLEIPADDILIAVGRIPNSDSLALENTNVITSDKGYIVVNEYLQTSDSSIYAIGDVVGKMPFTHVAGMEGKLIVQNAVLGLRRKANYDTVPWNTYLSPEIFHLGLTEEQAKEKNVDVNVYKMNLHDVDRFVTDHETDGFVKVLTDKKGYIIGAHAIGKGAGDWMQEVVFAKKYKRKLGDISQVIHPYPNHAAAVQRTADLYWREALFAGWIPKVIKKYIQWFR